MQDCTPSYFISDTTWRMTIEGTDTSTGIIGSFLSDLFSIYPNPANTQLTFSSSFIHSNEAVTISITNVLSEIMQEEKRKWSNETNINIKSLPKGVYFVQVQTEKGKWVERFVKE